MGSAFIKTRIVYRNFVPRRLLITQGFPLSIYIGSLTEVTQTCHAVNSLRQQRQPVASVFSRMMNSENAPKSMSHKINSGKTPSKFAILCCVKPSDCKFVIWLMPFLKFDLPRL